MPLITPLQRFLSGFRRGYSPQEQIRSQTDAMQKKMARPSSALGIFVSLWTILLIFLCRLGYRRFGDRGSRHQMGVHNPVSLNSLSADQ